MATITLFTDGGARGNPGPSAIGVVAVDEAGQELYASGKKIGVATNNEAEYLAFLSSLEWLEQQKLTQQDTAIWKLDSMLVVEQLNKRWKVKDLRMQQYAKQAWEKLAQLSCSIQIKHIPRAQNKRADELVNQALDQV